MKIKNRISKKILSVLICVVLILTYVPFTAFAAENTDNPYYDRVADANTMDSWKEYFPLKTIEDDPLTQENEYDPLSTENAGGVWTDKSVFTNTDAFPDNVEMINDGENFLTALSALAANKEVVGYSTVPTDTVFILDLSNSMSSTSVTQLVSATNQAITRLQEMNNNNRVGVVLYSGSSNNRGYDNAVAQLMPIDRYTTTRTTMVTDSQTDKQVEIGVYVEYTSGTVRLARKNNAVAVEGSNGSVNSESKQHSGATYIQAGLWEAWEMFNAIPDNDIVIGANNWQEGEARMPIVVLMSDGAPTLGTSYFDDVKNSTYGSDQDDREDNLGKANVGNGNDSNITAGQGFLVQLTASYIKNRIESKYKVNEEGYAGRSLFYTLGFNITAGNNTSSSGIAYSVLNPDASTITDTLWSTYNRLGGNGAMTVTTKGRNGGSATVSVYKNSYATDKSYVDEYFSASGNGLQGAFADIVEEILLQSRYYPTHLEGGSPDFSGYVEFTDTLGEYMEIKHINGILLGDTLFDGHMMASKLADTSEDGLGTPDNPTDLGDEFIWSVQERLGIANVTDARNLVSAAYKAEQLCYITDGQGNVTKWSNYIGWYADAEGKYLAHWDEDSTKTAPEKAVYKIKSYGFLGETTGSIKNSDMMYMSVQVRTDIATGFETVSWKIPAALVPMVTYLVEVDGVNVETATSVRVSVEDENVTPIRLVYETGLRSDLNEFNITRITDEEHIAADGHTRVFWNNYFANLDADSHDEHITTMSAFTPNKENERFYYTFDSAVHKATDTGYALVTQAEGLDPAKIYYHRRYVFSAGSDEPIFFYEQMSAESVQAAIDNGFKSNFESLEHNTIGAWVVPEGTPARELDMYDKQKTANPTNSARMVFHPYMTTQNNLVAVDMNLGNNGLLAVTPATGIKISKTVDIFEDGTSDTFKFRITASESGTFDSWITDLDATPEDTATKVTLTNGVYEFEMKKDQTFWLSGLSANTAYTVEEISENSDYKIKSVKVNNMSSGLIAAGTVAQYMIDDVRFVNTAVGEGDLVITKQVVDQNGNTVDINDSVIFTAQVALTDADGDPVSGTFEANNTAGTIAVPASGIFTVNLKEGESFILRNIPEETRYTVTETNIPAGFALDDDKSSLDGIVDSTANDQALIVNEYTPVPTTGADVIVNIYKQISGNRTDWMDGESYTFTVQRVDVARATKTNVFTTEIDHLDQPKVAMGTLQSETYAAAGTYYYTITETVGTRGGITYDAAERRFSVEVADSDMDGDLEIVAVNNEAATTVTKQGDDYTVTANFNNVYAPTGSDAVTINVLKRMQGDYRLNGFQFALYDHEDIANANEILRSTVTDATGNATFTLTYAPDDATMEGVTYTYWMAEINTGNPNITYDNTVYRVDVTVKDNGDGTITATPVVSGLAQGETVPSFTNIFTPSASAYVTLTANKTIEGDRVLNANEFAFVIEALTAGAPMPANTTVKNAVNGAVVFDIIEFDTVGTYKYKIYESQNDKIGGFAYDGRFYEITVTVVDNGDATLSASVSRVVKENENESGRTLAANEIMNFVNTYDATDAKVTISGTKLLTGKTMQDDEFTFVLDAETNSAPMPVDTTVGNKANGAFTFGEITFSKAGTYVYKIYEQDNGDSRYDFDKSVYTVTITVTDNSRGLLSARVTLQKNNMDSSEIVFRNGFIPTPLTYDIYTEFGGEKVLNGRTLEDGEFEFQLINAITGEQVGETVKNDAAGAFKFPAVTLPEAGTYHFKIVEVLGDEKGVSYDAATYHVVLGVEQNNNGVLSIVREELHIGKVTKEDVGGVLTEVTIYEDITQNGTITFKNIYKAYPAYVALEATKILEGRDLIDGEFKFDLHKTEEDFAYDESTLVQDDVVLTLNDDGTGNVAFMPILFETEGTYYYVIVEDELDEKGIVSDKSAYKVEVTVTDNHNGDLVAAVKVNGTDISGSTVDIVRFTNTYAAAATEIVIEGTKTLEGRDLKADEFSFELYDRDGAKLETVKNAADGKFSFTAIPVEKAGKYVYTVKEMLGSEETITYDSSVYTVTATVTDNLDGTFDVQYVYAKGDKLTEGMIFVNTYTVLTSDPAPTPDPKPTPDPDPTVPHSPNTGDYSNLHLWFALLFVSGGTVVTLAAYDKKRKTAEN